jgi:hypothetical protein
MLQKIQNQHIDDPLILLRFLEVKLMLKTSVPLDSQQILEEIKPIIAKALTSED